MGLFRKTVPPPVSNTPPQENYDSYSNLPNPGIGLQGDYKPNPYRTHAPFALLRAWFAKINQGDPTIQRTPDVPLNTYMKTGVALPPSPAYQPAHGVFVPDMRRDYNPGWSQQYIPQDARRATILDAVAPPPLLSAPVRVVTHDQTMSGKRVPQKLRAPKATRG